jgi:pantoate--beta-alanine ligase
MQKFSKAARAAGKTIAFVPTMGHLHTGHLSLIEIAKKQGDLVVVSIFVNPMQFSAGEDYKNYPRTLLPDFRLLKQSGVDIVFCPSVHEMYSKLFQTSISVRHLSRPLCGRYRAGHFAGVATVVLKLFNIVNPHVAIFGEKDYQQQLVVKKMVEDLNLKIKVLTGKTVRESGGLAMSSRNRYLNLEEKEAAAALFQALQLGAKLIKAGERRPKAVVQALRRFLRKKNRLKVQYLEILNADDLTIITKICSRVIIALAVFIGKTRLIDNLVLDIRGG